jgi:hypothetical protein
MRAKIVTCLGPGGWEKYGRRFADSYAAFWPDEIPLEIWCHDLDELPMHPAATFHSLHDIPAFADLKAHLKGVDGPSLQYCFKALALSYTTTPDLDWIGFIDADTEIMRPIDDFLLGELFDNAVDLTYLYRKSIKESEGSWFAFNLQTVAGASLLSDYYGIYASLEAFHYKKAHDNAVLDRLVTLHQAHGLRVKNLAEGALGLDAFHQSSLDAYVIHYKGPNKDTIADPGMQVPSRYHLLCDILRHSIKETGKATIVEMGTWNGSRAIQMAETAFAEGLDTVTYFGFDTFDAGNNRTYEGHTKPHAASSIVEGRLANYAMLMQRQGKVFDFRLIAGNSVETLPVRSSLVADATFAYIDGGHSYETVASDYACLKHVPYIVFDDIIPEPEDGAPEGPRRVFQEDVTGNKRLFNTGNGYLGLQQSISYGLAWGKDCKPFNFRAPLVVKPVESVEAGEQHDHITENTASYTKWIAPYQAHAREALLVSAGPTLPTYLDEIRERQAAGATIFAVKHAFPVLKAAGIRPDFTIVLDPRPVDGKSTHGIIRTDLFAQADSDDRFLVASMTNPSVRKALETYGAQIYGWHALTKSTQETALPEFEKGLVIGGGTCAATRMPMLAFVMGFRRFTFYGYDFFYPADVQQEDIKQSLMTVAIGSSNTEYRTTGELVAAMQDLAEWTKWMIENRLTVNFVGPGAGATIWQDTVVNYQTPKEYPF